MQRPLWAGSAHNLPCHLVDVLTESCQSSTGNFLLFYLHSALLPPLPPTVLLLLLLPPPPPLFPRLEAAEEEEEATAAEAACVEDVVAQSSEDFSAKKNRKKKQTNTLIARQHKFAHSARHASPFATAEPQCSNTVATTTATKNEATHKSRHR